MDKIIHYNLNNSTLFFKWTTSRGAQTYGYNICSLWVRGEKLASNCGGGYDMKGRAFGDFLQEYYQERLIKLHRRAGSRYSIAPKGSRADKAGKGFKRLKTKSRRPYSHHGEFYGLTAYYKRGESTPYEVCLDGACGFESMQKIAKAIGITLKWQSQSNASSLYTMTDKRAEKPIWRA